MTKRIHRFVSYITVPIYIVQLKRSSNKYSTYENKLITLNKENAVDCFSYYNVHAKNLKPRLLQKLYKIDYNAPTDKALMAIDTITLIK